MRLTLVLSVTALIFPLSLSAQTIDDMAVSLGVKAKDISITGGNKLSVKGDLMTLEASTLLVAPGELVIEDGVFFAKGKGRVIISKATSGDPSIISSLVNKPFMMSCPSDVISDMKIDGLISEADMDAIMGASGPERVSMNSVNLKISHSDSCWTIIDSQFDKTLAAGADGSTASITSGKISLSPAISFSMTGLAFSDKDGVSVMSLNGLSGAYRLDGTNNPQISARIDQAMFTPSRMLYPDLLARLPIRSPDEPMTINGTFSLVPGSENSVFSLDVRAERMLDAKINVKFTGTPLTDPMGSSLISADGGFRDEGLFPLIEAFTGESLPERIRSGKGLPDVLASDQLSSLRAGFADWIAVGQGSFSITPETSVNGLMMGASMMFGEDNLLSLLNLKQENVFK